MSGSPSIAGIQAVIGGASPLKSVDRSGSIVVGGVSQLLAKTNPFRKLLIIENPLTAVEQGIGAAENLYVNVGGQLATLTFGNFANLGPGGSVAIQLQPGNIIDFSDITVNAATTGHSFNAKEFF